MSGRAAKRKRAADAFDALGLSVFTAALVLAVCLREGPDQTHGNVLVTSVLSAGVAFLIAGALAGGKARLRLRSMDPALVGFVLLAAVSVTWASDKRGAAVRAVELAGVAMTFFAARVLAKDRIKRCIIPGALLATALVCVLYGYQQYLYGFDDMLRAIETHPESLLAVPQVTAENLPDFMTRIQEREVFSFFFLSNVFAGYLLLFIPFLAALVVAAWRAGRRAEAGVSLAALSVTAGALVLTKSKGAILVAGGVLGLFAAGAALAKRIRPRVLVFAGIVLLGIAAVLVTASVWNDQEIIDRGGSLSVRLGFVKGAIAVARRHPVTGVGAGNFHDFYYTYKPLWAHETQEAHSSILQASAELGLAGAGVLVLVALTIAYEVTRKRSWVFREPAEKTVVRRDIVAGMLGGGVAILAPWLALGTETAFTVVLFLLVWAAGFAGAVWLLERLREERLHRTLYVGAACGLAAITLHSLIDIDFEVMGPALVAAAIAGWLTADPDAPGSKGVSFTGVRAWAALAAALLASGLLIFAVAQPMGRAERLLARAVARARAGLPEQAMALARLSVKADPSYVPAYVALSGFHAARWQSLGSESDFDAARERLEQAIARRPQQSTLRRKRGDLYALAYKKDRSFFDRTVAAYEEAIERYPGDTRALLALAQFIDGHAQSESRAPDRDRLLSEALRNYHKFLEVTEVNTDRHLTPPAGQMYRITVRIDEIRSQVEETGGRESQPEIR